MVTPRKDNGDAIPTVSLKEHIEHVINAQTGLLDERAKAHGREHFIHEEAHKREHEATQTAIGVATSSLNSRLEVMDKETTTKLDTLTEQLKLLVLERASSKGYILGVGAVIAILVVIANFVGPLLVQAMR